MPQNPTPDERRIFILKALAKAGRLSTADLSAHFNISEDSARRDLRELAAEGLIQRVHGAALPVSPATMPFATRYKTATTTKDRLAKKAASLILPNQLVLFDGGTTNLAIAKHIPATLSFTAITNSPMIALALNDHPHARTIIIGGTFDKHSQMTLGANVLQTVQQINADICLFGIHGIDYKAGLTTADYDEAAIKTAMIDAATETIAVATADKMGTAASHKIGPTSKLNRLITEAAENTAQLDIIAKMGTKIEIA